jgi:transposase
MSKKRNRHTEEFKREAVRLMLSRGDRTVSDVARGLGVTTGDLHRWRDKHGSSAQTKAAPAETVEQENKRLRKEVERLRLEREILKKAAAFFAKEST